MAGLSCHYLFAPFTGIGLSRDVQINVTNLQNLHFLIVHYWRKKYYLKILVQRHPHMDREKAVRGNERATVDREGWRKLVMATAAQLGPPTWLKKKKVCNGESYQWHWWPAIAKSNLKSILVWSYNWHNTTLYFVFLIGPCLRFEKKRVEKVSVFWRWNHCRVTHLREEHLSSRWYVRVGMDDLTHHLHHSLVKLSQLPQLKVILLAKN